MFYDQCGLSVSHSVCVQDYRKSADFIETWCYDWAYQSEEPVNFLW